MKTRSTLSFLSLTLLAFTLQGQVTSPAPYCNAGFDDDPFPVNDAIFGVTLGTLNNQSNIQCPAPHYIYYNNLAAPTLTLGGTYTLSVTFDVHGGVGIGAWIDYNHNNLFDASEKVMATPAAGIPMGIYTHSVSFTVPAGTSAGTSRLRIRIVEDDNYNMQHNYDILACNTGTTATNMMDWGETEDYQVNISTGNVATTGIDVPEEEAAGILAFPNPVEQELNIMPAAQQEIKDLRVLSLSGQELSVHIKNEGSGKTVDLSSLSQGLYLVWVQTDKGSYRLKIHKH